MTAARDHTAETEAAAWKERGNCVGLAPDLFFPVRGGDACEAIAVCAGCVVRAECLEYALVNRETHGIWGGKSERQRRRMRKDRGLARGYAPQGAA